MDSKFLLFLVVLIVGFFIISNQYSGRATSINYLTMPAYSPEDFAPSMPTDIVIEPERYSPSYGLPRRSYFSFVNTQQHRDRLMQILGPDMGQAAVNSLDNYQALESALTPEQYRLHEGYGEAHVQTPGAVL